MERGLPDAKSLKQLFTDSTYSCGKIQSHPKYSEHFFCGHRSVQDFNSTLKLLDWRWEPDNCQLPTSPAEVESLVNKFIEKVDGGSFIFLGDSVIEEQFISLRCLLGRHVLRETPTSFAVGNRLTFAYVKNHILVDPTTLRMDGHAGPEDETSNGHDKHLTSPPVLSSAAYKEDLAKVNLEDVKTWDNYTKYLSPSPILHLIQDERIHLIFSVGNHWHGKLQKYPSMVKTVLRYLNRNFKGVQVVFRGIGHGHYGCSIQELQESTRSDGQVAAMKEMPRYNWRMFSHWNAVWKYEIERLNNNRIIFMDTSPITANRADGHLGFRREDDCLHWCLPGVIDYWNFLLMSFIVHDDQTDSGASRGVKEKPFPQ